MRYGQILLEREQSARLLGWCVRFFLTAALTGAQTADGCIPFALGCIAASGPGAAGGAALAGELAGAVLFLDFADALSALAVGILIVTAVTAFRDARWMEKPAALPLLSAGLFASVEGIYVAQSLSPLEQLVPCVAMTCLTGVSSWLLRGLLEPSAGRQTADGALFLAAVLLLAISRVTVLEVSVGRALLCLLLAYIAYDRGALSGVTAGLGLGLLADLYMDSGSCFFTASYALAGLLGGSGQVARRRTASALGFLAGFLAILLPVRIPAALPALAEAGVGAGLFVLLPGKLFGGKRLPKPVAAAGGENRVKERLMKAAEALRDLYDSMGRNTPQLVEENPAIVFDRAAERVCRDCALCRLCWQKEYTDTFNALNDATPYLLERGRAMAKDFPPHFASRCIHLPDFITAVSEELSAFLLRRQYRRQLEETRRSAKGQYAQMSDLLTATAAGLEAVTAFTAGEPSCTVGAALRPRKGETVCGDTVVSFQTESGDWRLLLADGMGSGEAARRESALTCRLLRQFLEANIEPEAALKTLNAAMALRGAETGSFTTIDLCICRNETGELVFYKFGAAPSYLKKGGSVRRVTGVSLPAGLRGTPCSPDVTRVSLEPGGFAVMISDGVADPGQDEWLQDLLAGWEGDDPQTLAGLILAESVRREKLLDDCAVQVLYRPEKRTKRV